MKPKHATGKPEPRRKPSLRQLRGIAITQDEAGFALADEFFRIFGMVRVKRVKLPARRKAAKN